MGRPIKRNAYFFFHDADASSDEKVLYLESKYGTDGYAFYFKMLEALTRSNNFELHYNIITFNAYAKKFGIEAKRFNDILEDCIDPKIAILKKVDGKVYSEDLIEGMKPLIEKRLKNRMRYDPNDDFCNRNEVEVTEKAISATETTHSIEEESIIEEKREEKKRKDKSVREEKRGRKNGSDISRIIIRS
ncbi:MAG: DUF4373 domain-containing protein [Melioribacteraceae bacterium]|nr:DUF4373 domain-containing protein [Melioribacteraceae bacterium]